MSLHDLENPAPRKQRKRVGRGNGNNWGRTCGRGEKGQMSRSGAHHRPYFEGGQIPLIRRLPKRGFKSYDHQEFSVVNIKALEAAFEDGETVDLEALSDRGLLSNLRNAGLKILGEGELTRRLTVKAHAFSGSAKAKIEAAGGTIESL